MARIKYGLKNVYYAVATIDDDNEATYATPVRIPGAVNLSLEPQGDQEVFNADNIDYFVSQGNNGYEGDLEIALVPESFEKDVLGAIEDNKGVLIEDIDAPVVHFALLFQFEQDTQALKHVFYNCTATRPTVEGETKGESIDPKTDTLKLRAGSIHNEALGKDVTKARSSESTDSAVYNGWFTAVYQSTAVSNG